MHKKIKPSELLKDLQAGMSTTQAKDKYGVSEATIHYHKRDFVKKGLLQKRNGELTLKDIPFDLFNKLMIEALTKAGKYDEAVSQHQRDLNIIAAYKDENKRLKADLQEKTEREQAYNVATQQGDLPRIKVTASNGV